MRRFISAVILVLAASFLGIPIAGATPTAPGTYRPVTAARILDTGLGLGAPKAAVAPGGTVMVQVSGHGGVPTSGAGAVALLLAAGSSTAAGSIIAYPAGTTRPATSNLAFSTGHTTANLVVVALSSTGRVSLYNNSPGTVRIIGDVYGYYLSGTVTAPGALKTVAASRILDTTTGLGAARAPIPANGTLTFQVGGRGNFPSSGAGTVLLDVQAGNGTAAGTITAYPAGGTRPPTTNLNYGVGRPVTDLVTVPISPSGQVTLYNLSSGTVDVAADTQGYFLSGAATQEGSYRPVASPGRILDTGASTPVPANGTIQLSVLGRGGVPASGVNTAVLTVVVGSSTTNGFLTVWPSGPTAPNSAVLDFSTGETIAAQVSVQPGPDGKISLHNGSSGTIRIIVDTQGYYAGSLPAPSWHAAESADPTSGNPQDVSCPTTTFCAAVDAGGSVLTYNGSTWSAPLRIDPGVHRFGSYDYSLSLVAVSCTSVTFCVTVDNEGDALTYNGSTWSARTTTHLFPPAGPGLDEVSGLQLSCVSSTFCLEVDTHGAVSRFNGSTWTQQASIGDSTEPIFPSVSCATVTFCLAEILNGDTYRYNGTSWTAVSGASIPPGLVSCTSATFCAGFSDGAAYTFNGTAWSAGVTVAGLNHAAETMDCVSSQFCVVVGDLGHSSRYNGVSWSAATQFNTGNSREKLSCASTTMCVAVDGSGQTWGFNGSSWDSAPVFDPWRGGVAQSMSCRSPVFCVAVDQGGFATVYDGTKWSTAVKVTDDSAQSVSCASTTFCVAVGQGGEASKFNGTSWSVPVTFDSAHLDDDVAAAVSCATTTMCVAVDSAGYAAGEASRFDGTRWSPPTTVGSPGGGFSAISCPTSSFCVALESGSVQSVAYTYNGSTWSAAHVFSDVGGLTAVSCTSSTFCIASDNGGRVVRYNGSTWSPATTVDPSAIHGEVDDDISCSSTTFCALVNEDGAAALFNGSSWTTPASINPRPNPSATLDAVTCPAATYCVALSTDGFVISRY